MARFARIDSQIRANRPISSKSFQGSRTEPFFFCESRFVGLKIANRRFEAIRASRSHVMKIVVFLRSDLRESIRVNCADSRCESPGHLRNGQSTVGGPKWTKMEHFGLANAKIQFGIRAS